MGLKPVGGDITSQAINDNLSALQTAIDTTTVGTGRIADGSITSSKLKTTSDADKIKLANLSDEVRQAMAGTTSIDATPADASVTVAKVNQETWDKIDGDAVSTHVLTPQQRGMNMAAGFRAGTITFNSLSASPSISTTFIANPDDGPFDDVDSPKVLRWTYSRPTSGDSANSYYMKSASITSSSKVRVGFWARLSDLSGFGSGLYFSPVMNVNDASGTVYTIDMGGDINNTDFVSNGYTHERIGGGTNPNSVKIKWTTQAVFGDWVQFKIEFDKTFSGMTSVSFYNRIVMPTGASGKVDVMNFVLLVDSKSLDLLPNALYRDTANEMLGAEMGAKLDTIDSDIGGIKDGTIKTTPDPATVTPIIDAAQAPISVKKARAVNTLNLMTGMRDGTRTINSLISTGFTYSFVDNAESDPPFDAVNMPKLFRWRYSRPTSGDYNLSFFGYRFEPADISAGESAVYGLWIRKSDIDNMDHASFQYQVIFSGANSGSDVGITSPSMSWTNEEAQTVGTTSTTTNATYGVSLTTTVLAEYEGWVFHQVSLSGFIPNSTHITLYFRIPLTVGATGHLDCMAVTVLKNSIATEIDPFHFYADNQSQTAGIPMATKLAAIEGQIADIGGSRISGKTLYIDGDSISYGQGWLGAYGKILADDFGAVVTNEAVSGATLATGTVDGGGTPRHWICDSVVANVTTDYDYAIISGGFNDFGNDVPIGALDTSDNYYISTLDTTTVIGALETIFRHMIQNHPRTKLYFLVTHPINRTPVMKHATGLNFTDYYNAIVSVCQRYAVPMIDMFRNSRMVTAYTEVDAFTDSADGTHPTEDGYRTFYMPVIEDVLRL